MPQISTAKPVSILEFALAYCVQPWITNTKRLSY